MFILTFFFLVLLGGAKSYIQAEIQNMKDKCLTICNGVDAGIYTVFGAHNQILHGPVSSKHLGRFFVLKMS